MSANTIKKLIFGPGLLGVSIPGWKNTTIRKYRPEAHDFSKGEIVQGVFERQLDVLLEITSNTEVVPFTELPKAAAVASGYKSPKEAFQDLKDHYYKGDLKLSDLAAIIRYQVAQINGVPIVAYNAKAGSTVQV